MTNHRDLNRTSDLRRRSRRASVLWSARIARDDEGTQNACAILNLSAGGAKLRLENDETLPTRVALDSGYFGRLDGRVIWRQGNVVGLAFLEAADAVARRFRESLPQGLRAAVA